MQLIDVSSLFSKVGFLSNRRVVIWHFFKLVSGQHVFFVETRQKKQKNTSV